MNPALIYLTLMVLAFSCGGTPEPPIPTNTPPSTTASRDIILPDAIRVLDPHFQEAFLLLPRDEYASRYYELRFEHFDITEYESAPEDVPILSGNASRFLPSEQLLRLSKALRDTNAEQWILDKVRALAPTYGDDFEAADTAGRILLFRQMVESGAIHPYLLDVEIYTRWVLSTAQPPPQNLEHQIATALQNFDTHNVMSTLSQKERMTRWNELTVCELVMHDVIGTRDTLDVIKDGECNVPTLIELAESSTHVVPTEDEYQERVRDIEHLQKSN